MWIYVSFVIMVLGESILHNNPTGQRIHYSCGLPHREFIDMTSQLFFMIVWNHWWLDCNFKTKHTKTLKFHITGLLWGEPQWLVYSHYKWPVMLIKWFHVTIMKVECFLMHQTILCPNTVDWQMKLDVHTPAYGFNRLSQGHFLSTFVHCLPAIQSKLSEFPHFVRYSHWPAVLPF